MQRYPRVHRTSARPPAQVRPPLSQVRPPPPPSRPTRPQSQHLRGAPAPRPPPHPTQAAPPRGSTPPPGPPGVQRRRPPRRAPAAAAVRSSHLHAPCVGADSPSFASSPACRARHTPAAPPPRSPLLCEPRARERARHTRPLPRRAAAPRLLPPAPWHPTLRSHSLQRWRGVLPGPSPAQAAASGCLSSPCPASCVRSPPSRPSAPLATPPP